MVKMNVKAYAQTDPQIMQYCHLYASKGTACDVNRQTDMASHPENYNINNKIYIKLNV